MTPKPTYEELEQQISKLEKESEKRFFLLAESLADTVYEFDAKGKFTYVNQAGVHNFGYSKDELLKGIQVRDTIPKEDYDISKESIGEIFKGKVIVAERTFIRKNGTEFIGEIHSGPIYEGKNIIGVRGVVRDITKRKQAEERLRESEELLTSIFDTAKDSIFIKDSQLKYKKINPAMERLFNKSSEKIIGKIDSHLFGKEAGDHTLKVDKRVLKGEIVEEFPTKPVEGVMRSFHTIKVPLKNSDGKITGICGIARDITEQKQAEQEKIKAQRIAGEQKKLALVGQVAGKMAHDFNNIMGIIMGNTELALMDCKDAEIKKTLEIIFEQTIRGKNLTKNLVAFAKSQEPKQEFFKINETVYLIINLLKKDIEWIELIREDKAGVPDLLADSGMVEHALLNLMQNSIHAISMVEHPRIIIRTYSLNDNICLEIEDNGCGIPDKSLDNIYEPSFTLKGNRDITGSYKPGIKGTGYGMSNVKKYIEQHKGNILVESTLGLGTKFTISLPAVKTELTKKEKEEIRKEKTLFNKYILIVEDEPAISGVQYKILSQEPGNHKVDIANDGQVAMDLFKRNKYDLISLDYVLPGNINGMDVYNHIRETNKTIPILFISGNIEFLESIKGLKQKDGYIDHLPKPCQNKDYVKNINELFTKT